MTIATIKIKVPPEKRVEILQTLTALLGPIRLEQGCISCNVAVDVKNENIIYFKEEWQTSEDLDTHLNSRHYNVLIGAMALLRNKPEIRFSTIASIAGVETVTSSEGSDATQIG